VRITDVTASVAFGRSVFVRVFTDEGITGLGECSPMHLTALVHFVNDVLKPLCVGKNPLEIEKIWSAMFYDTYKLGDTGLKMEAIAGVDIALWDIFGKVTGLPLTTLLGGAYREKVQMYASLGVLKS
jgi:L-alanine-DL-glutamate epimerase-like enolase superfamily enzyme